jgi:hypothetical protein
MLQRCMGSADTLTCACRLAGHRLATSTTSRRGGVTASDFSWRECSERTRRRRDLRRGSKTNYKRWVGVSLLKPPKTYPRSTSAPPTTRKWLIKWRSLRDYSARTRLAPPGPPTVRRRSTRPCGRVVFGAPRLIPRPGGSGPPPPAAPASNPSGCRSGCRTRSRAGARASSHLVGQGLT